MYETYADARTHTRTHAHTHPTTTTESLKDAKHDLKLLAGQQVGLFFTRILIIKLSIEHHLFADLGKHVRARSTVRFAALLSLACPISLSQMAQQPLRWLSLIDFTVSGVR